MIACVRLLHWAAAIARRSDSTLAGMPLVIGGHAWEAAPVVALSAEAGQVGVRVGMSLRQAWALCPDAHFLLPDAARWQGEFDALLDLLWDFSDRVEPPAEPFRTDTSDFYLDLGRLRPADARYLASQLQGAIAGQCGVESRIGLAANRFTAGAGTTCGSDAVTLIPAGQEAAFLAPLPISLLPLEPVQAHRLSLLGIHILGQFAALPARAMLTQFGMAGPLLHRLACGEDSRPVEAIPCPQTEVLAHEFEPPVADLGLIQAVMEHISERLMARLSALNLTCPEVQFTVELRCGEMVTVRYRPREPVGDAAGLRRVLLRLLDQAVLEADICGITVHLRHLQPAQARQLALFGDELDGGRIAPDVLERLAARHGQGLFYEIRRAEQPTGAYLPERYRLASVVA